MMEYIILGVFIYLALGFIVSIYITFWCVKKLDSAAQEGTIGFKLLIIPGLCVFWPLFILRLRKELKEPPIEDNTHRKAAGENS